MIFDIITNSVRWLWFDPSAGWIRCGVMVVAIAVPLGVYALIRYASDDEI